MKYAPYVVAMHRDDGTIALVDYTPSDWHVVMSPDTIGVLTDSTEQALGVWEMENKGQSRDEAIQEAIVATFVESWEDEA